MSKLYKLIEKPISGEWGDEDTEGNGIPVLRTTNFTNEGNIKYENIVTRLIKNDKAESKFLKFGDIIIEKSGGSPTQPVGRVVFFEGKPNTYLFNNFTSVLRIKDKNSIFSKYLFYTLFAKYNFGETKKFQNKTTGILNLKLDRFIKEVDVSLPPLEEQHKIASILDTVSEALKLRKQQLNELDLLVKSKFVEMFGYIDKNNNNFEYTSLGVCCKINPKKSEDTRLTSNLDISFISMPSVSEKGSIDTSNIRKYSEVKKGFTYFAENDVLFAKITPCMENGKGCIAHGLKNNIGFGSTEFHVLRPIPQKSNPYWLYYLSTFEAFRNDAKQNMTGSAGQRRVPASFLENYPVALPPIGLQNKFASFVQHVDELKSEVQESINQLQTLFDSLMQQYFE